MLYNIILFIILKSPIDIYIIQRDIIRYKYNLSIIIFEFFYRKIYNSISFISDRIAIGLMEKNEDEKILLSIDMIIDEKNRKFFNYLVVKVKSLFFYHIEDALWEKNYRKYIENFAQYKIIRICFLQRYVISNYNYIRG